MYKVRFWFEHGGGCLWSDDKDTKMKFGYQIHYDALPLSASTKEQLHSLENEYGSYLNWDDPGSPSPWTTEKKIEFLASANEMYHTLCKELNKDFIIYNLLLDCIAL
ncbi:MAG: hypothetical protein ACI39E_01220 [Acutalibacteraceae bacterium]